MAKNFLKKASKVYKLLKARGENPKWPLPKDVVNSFNFDKPQSEKQKLYKIAKQLYIESLNIRIIPKISYVGTTIKYLKEYIAHYSRAISLFNSYKNYFNDPDRDTFSISREDFDLLAPLVKYSLVSNNKKKYLHYIDFKTKEKSNTLPINFNIEPDKMNPLFQEEEVEGWEDSFISTVRAITTSIDTITFRKTRFEKTHFKPTNIGIFPYIINESLIKNNVNPSLKEKILSTYNRYVSPKQDNDCFHYTLSLVYPHLSNKYKSLRLFSNGNSISIRHIPIIAKSLNLYIKERHFVGKAPKFQQKSMAYGDPSHPQLSVVFYKNHCFLDEDTSLYKEQVLSIFELPITRFRSTKTLSSLNFIRLLLGLDSLENQISKNLLTDIPSYDALTKVNYEDLEIKGNEPHILDGVIPHTINNVKSYTHLDFIPLVFFDFETYTNKDKAHIPYMCCCNNNFNDDNFTFKGINSGKDFLDYLFNLLKPYDKKQRIYVIAHNLGYDLSFLLGINGFSISSRIGNSSRNTKSATAYYFGRKLRFLDSNAFLQMKLEKFNTELNLGLDYKKGIFPYDAMNKRRFYHNSCSINKALKAIPENDHILFLKSISDYLILSDTSKDPPKKFKITDYSEAYCKQDVNILRAGFIKLRNELFELTTLDVLDYVSMPGLSLEYVRTLGLLDGVPELSGVVRQFVQQTIVGGRNQTNSNTSFKINTPVEDLDANSLYPTCYKLLKIPTDEPISILPSDTHYSSTLPLDDIYMWYFLEVDVLTVRKPYPIASLSSKNKDGVREWIDKPGTYYLNHIQLNDLCTFQQITFINKGGIGWSNSSPYIEWNDFVDKLYNLRKEYSSQDRSSMANNIKLILNSIYGRTLMAPITSDEKIISDIEGKNKDYYEKYLNDNFDILSQITTYNGYNDIKCATIITKKSVYRHKSYNHIASVILAYSKHIMNKVIYLALDNNIPVYYTDTDSLFIPKDKVDTLAILYQNKYNHSILGNSLGQFKSDYTKQVPPKSTDIHCSKAIFLGKKLYCTELTYTLDNKTHTTYIAKIKGIPEAAVDYTINKLSYSNKFELFEDLARGISIDFDLTLNNSKACFDVGKDFKFKTLNEFTRTIKI